MKIYISDMTFEESLFVRGDEQWKASTLYDYVKTRKMKPFKYPLVAFDLSQNDCFKLDNLNDFVFQMKRVQNCDYNIPIILDDLGQVADGYHRVLKAILDSKEYIMAYRIDKMPKSDY